MPTMIRSAALACAFLLCAAASAQELPSDPGHLASYLAEREQREAGIRPGTERAVLWSRGRPERSRVALVYLHGYSATRQEVSPLPERVASALGANVFFTRLTGHGRGDDAMLSGTLEAWRADAREALQIGRLIGEQVVVLSTSTGGTLSTWLASETCDGALAAMVMLSPNFAPRDRTLYVFDWPLIGPLLAHGLRDAYRSWQPYNERHARYWTWRYPYAALAELARLVRQVERIDKSSIRVPTLMIYAPGDTVIDPAAVVATFRDWGGARKRLVAFDGSADPAQHVLAGDILSPASTEVLAGLIVAYLQENLDR